MTSISSQTFFRVEFFLVLFISMFEHQKRNKYKTQSRPSKTQTNCHKMTGRTSAYTLRLRTVYQLHQSGPEQPGRVFRFGSYILSRSPPCENIQKCYLLSPLH
jgi:hypothetical protein